MAEKINIIVTEKALTDLNEAIVKVKELESFINQASSPSTNNNYTASLKQQALETKNLTDAIIRNERAEQARIRTERARLSLGTAQTNATNREQLQNESLSRSYVQLSNSREQAKNKLQDLIASQTASTAQVRQAQREFDVLNRRVQQADRAVGRFSKTNNVMGNSLRGVTNLMGAFGISTGLYLGASIILFVDLGFLYNGNNQIN